MPSLNFTYYIGAGASCNVLPLVKDFPERLNKFRIDILSNRNSIESEDQTKVNKLITDISWLEKESLNHASIDTFAKKLYIQNKDYELLKLKAALSCYFLYEQAIKNVDQRYDSFFASILEKDSTNIKLPENIKIISWNYDIQFEKSFAIYSNSPDYIATTLQAYPASSDRNNTIDYNKFAIVRLNGIAGVHLTQDGKIARYLKNFLSNSYSLELLKEIIKIYDIYLNKSESYFPLLNFAWEENKFKQTFLPNALEIAKNTEILIIIGYSFPFFNRKIDKMILEKMVNIKKIYLQVPVEDQEAYKERIISMNEKFKDKVFLINDLNRFYIPNEY
jgi:hypothetical protein